MNEGVSELSNVWSRVRQELEKTVEDARFFDVFLGDSFIHSIDNGTMTVVANSKFAASILGQKYESVIKQAVKNVFGEELKLDFKIKEELSTNAPVLENKPLLNLNSKTSIGSLSCYVANPAITDFVPMNANFGILYNSNKNNREESIQKSLKLIDKYWAYINE